jgi:hypothetical protein
MESFLGSVWFALLLGVVGLCAGVWLCKSKKI